MDAKFKSAFLSLKKPGQLKSLDGLRAIAILLVLITHTSQRIQGISFVFWNTEWATPLYNGWLGVDLFFVLSGFLIGSAVLKGLLDNTFSIFSFYMHRFFRIIPAYFAVILLVVCLKNLFPQQANAFLPAFNMKEVLMNLALMTDYISSNMGIPSWSLSIEEHFYLILPCFLIFIRKTETRVRILLLLIVGALIFRMMTYRAFSISDTYPVEPMMKLIYFPFHDRMDALSVGVLVAVMHQYFSFDNKIIRLVSFYVGLLLMGFVWATGALQGGFFNTTIQYSLICLGFGGILWGVLGDSTTENKMQTFLSLPFWVPIARISYSVYLTNLLMLSILSYFFVLKIWMFFFVLAACLLAALPLYLFIEYPCHQYGRKRFMVKSDQMVDDTVLAFEGNQVN